MAVGIRLTENIENCPFVYAHKSVVLKDDTKLPWGIFSNAIEVLQRLCSDQTQRVYVYNLLCVTDEQALAAEQSECATDPLEDCRRLNLPKILQGHGLQEPEGKGMSAMLALARNLNVGRNQFYSREPDSLVVRLF